jgi:mannose/cellobiose epimerase-like protein (N-acyl-D-glucosamine 2-epimerase family)
MKNLIMIFLGISLISSSLGQYNPTSPYLQNPDLAIDYTDSCAQFWMQTWDDRQGGFFTNIDRSGELLIGWGTNKNMLNQTRNIYGLTRAFMLTGDTTYLAYAKRAIDWMLEHAWDETNGGWFQELDINGNPVDLSADKTAFFQHYALLGLSAYYEATRDTSVWNWLIKGYQHLENQYWDSRSGYHGYYDLQSYDNQNAQNKSFNATVDAITTHLLYFYLMTEDEIYKQRLLQITEEIQNHLVASIPSQAIGFVEMFDSDWNPDETETMTIMGHVLKSAWCLGRINQLFPDSSYVNDAEYLIDHVLQNGYDQEYGGPYKDFDRISGELLLFGLSDTTKASWQFEQAILSGLELYDHTKEFKYLQMADESLNFYMNYFVDHQYGEVYENRTRYGAFAWNEAKGHSWKAGYHSIETGYYVYLYGNLFYAQQPIILNYQFEALPYDRELLLTPLAIDDTNLNISEILHNSQVYTNYNPSTRVLTLPANTGGHFKVTYECIPTIIKSSPVTAARKFELFQNYPNPFNPLTTIEYFLPQTGYITIKIFNILGAQVETVLAKEHYAGKHSYQFDGSHLASGVYFYQVKTDKFQQVKKMILLK